MMKICLSILIILVSFTVDAQSVPRMMQMADTLYKSSRYLDAIEFYDKISGIDENNKLAKYRLGICYKETLQYEEAKKILLDLGNTPNHEYQARSLYYYANLLRLDEKFKEADSVYSYLISIPDVNPELITLSSKQREGCALALRQQRANRGFTVKEFEDINSKFHDFGAVINPSNQHVVIASTRSRSVAQYEGNQYDGLLPDLVAFEKRRNNRYTSNTNDQRFNNLNTSWAEGSGSFTGDGNAFYFSSCKTEDGSGCQVLVSYLVDNVWSSPEPLNDYINEPGSENKQPFVTHGGDTLFFSSNRPGGLGGSDIWMSLKGLEAESWTPAINMGGVINTPEEEITPYYSSANNSLLFASDGHVGYGGYDIYLAKGVSFFEPEIYNLGFPFNSAIDDTYFTICDSIGFLASNRGDDHRILNIYYFDVGDEALFLSLLISGESLIDSRIVSRFRDIRSLDLVTFRVEDYQGFEFFEPVKREKPKPELVAAEEDTASLVDRQQQTVSSSGNKAKSQNDNIAGSAKAGSTTSGNITSSVKSTPTTSRADDSEASSASLDLAIGKRTEDGLIKSETIYFDYELTDLRPEGRQALIDLVNQLAGRQYDQISVLAYSDNIGKANYNLDLSRQRGEVVKKFLSDRGIEASKIKVLPRGEVASSKDHWFKRILSRKVEILIHPIQLFELNNAKTYIVRKDNSVAAIAKMLEVKEEDLRKWNGLTQETIRSGNTIRVYAYGKDPGVNYLVSEEDLDMFTRGKEG